MRALGSVAVLDVNPAGKIEFATEKANVLISRYLPASSLQRVPDFMMDWLKPQIPIGATLPLSGKTDGTSYLLARLTGKQDGYFQLLLEDVSDGLSAERLKALGLTLREAEVLFWISRGKTSPDIATILQCKTATVTKHTERIFEKLGVETRTAAAAIALEKMAS